MKSVDLRGFGGKENEIAKLFPELVRESAPLYDFIDPKTKKRYEIKKTGNKKLQAWIDPTKYINLTKRDRQIIFRFVRFDQITGQCVEVLDTTLGEVMDRFVPDEVLENARRMVKIFPKRHKFQFKLSIKWR